MKIVSFCLLLLTPVFSFGQDKSPEKLGKRAFKVLKSMDKLDKASYSDRFMSAELHRQIANDPDVQKSMRDFMLDLLKDTNEQGVMRWFSDQYEALVSTKKQYFFYWSEISFDKFVYKEKDDSGVNGLIGELYFNWEKRWFKVRVGGVQRNGRYYLIFLNEFHAFD